MALYDSHHSLVIQYARIFFTMIYMKYFFFFITLSLASGGFCTEESPFERFRRATQFADLGYKDLPTGLVTGIPHVTLEGVHVISKMVYGEGGTTTKDYFSEERSGFRGYIVEHGGETIVTIRGTKDPLHMLLDLHIMFATAGEDPKGTLDKLLQNTFNLGFVTRALVNQGLCSLTSPAGGGSSASSEAEAESLASALWGAATAAATAAAVEALPPEIRALHALVAEGDGTGLQKVLHDRFSAALKHAKICIETALPLNPEQKLRVVGHSLGGALATVAMAQLHAEGKLSTRDFEVNAICSPGSRSLLERFKTPIHETFTNRVFTLVRAGDLVSNFGDHIGQTVHLPAISEAALAVLKGDCTPVSASGWLSYLNPMAYGRTVAESLLLLKYAHSSVGAILDIRNLGDTLASAPLLPPHTPEI